MKTHFPRGRQLRALEQNVLKLRAFEMILILFYIEDMKECILSCIRATDKILDKPTDRLPEGGKNLYKKAWKIAVSDGVISDDERKEIERYIDYRNAIGHAIYDLTYDVSVDGFVDGFAKPPKYDAKAFQRIEALYRKIWDKIGEHYVVSLSMNRLLFDSTIRTYRWEIKRLKRKIRKQSQKRKDEIEKINQELRSISKADWKRLNPQHPLNKKNNGCLSDKGASCCYLLFELGLSDLAISYAVRLSLSAVKKRRMIWMTKVQPGA